LFAGCGQEEQPVKIDMSKKEQVRLKEEADVITYAYLPQYSHTVSFQRHHLLIEFLRKAIFEAADIVGIMPSKDQDFDPVRELAARVGISLDE